MRVIDSSALIKYFAKEESWNKVRQYLLEGVVTLELALKELGNALWKKILRDEMDINIAKTIIHDLYYNRPIKIIDQGKYIDKALELSIKYKITIYDALFIALAKENGLELITSDRKQAEAAMQEGIEVILL